MKGSLLVLFALVAATFAQQHACWKQSTTRGAGTVPTLCSPGYERQLALCYPNCRAGYDAVGPVCWQSCPSGWTDDGATCRIPLKVTGSDNHGCPWYDKCGLTFAKHCSKCPSGMVNDGCTCRQPLQIKAKDTYGRGAGDLTQCDPSKDRNGALCYDKCNSTMDGSGPVCWDRCGGDYPVQCGWMCGKAGFDCTAEIMTFVLTALTTVLSCADGPDPSCILGIAKYATSFILDGLCPANGTATTF